MARLFPLSAAVTFRWGLDLLVQSQGTRLKCPNFEAVFTRMEVRRNL